MAPTRNPPSRSIRRRGARKVRPHTGAADPQLVAAFEAGQYGYDDFKEGTAGRKAADAVRYRKRLADRPWATARSAAGHHPRAGTAPLYGQTPAGPVRLQLEALTAGEVRRAGKYMHATRQLIDDLAARPQDADSIRRVFARRFARWRPIGGYNVVSDPAAVIALAEQGRAEEEEPIFDSGRLPGRTRR